MRISDWSSNVCSSDLLSIRAKVVVNAAGPWGPALLGDAAPKVKLVKGTHLVLPAIAGCNEAFLLTARDGRVFFVIPWYGRTLVGRSEEHTSELQSLMRISYAVFCLKKKNLQVCPICS